MPLFHDIFTARSYPNIFNFTCQDGLSPIRSNAKSRWLVNNVINIIKVTGFIDMVVFLYSKAFFRKQVYFMESINDCGYDNNNKILI